MDTTERQIAITEAVRDLFYRPRDFDPLELLHDLTAHAVQLLPVAGAGVTIVDAQGRRAHVAASQNRWRDLQEVQFELGEGPCLDSTGQRGPLASTGLAEGGPGARRWPRFAPYAREAGAAAVATVSLCTPDVTVGALNLISTRVPFLTTHGLRLAQTLADAAACSFGHRQDVAAHAVVIEQLQSALDTRVVIEQAKGVLSEHSGISLDEAFVRLRHHARCRRAKLSALSAEVAQREIPAGLGRPHAG